MNMAKRKYSKMKKIEPSVQTLLFSTSLIDSGSSDDFYIDLSQSASLINRRFYRQGINWAVSSIKVMSGAGFTGQVVIQKLPNTWVMSNAWEKSFRAWQKMNDMALDETPSVKPRFLDFKIYADKQHHVDGFGANLLPQTIDTASAVTTAKVGEWEPSKLRIPDTTVLGNTREREMLAVGASYPGTGASGLNAVSLIEGYASSRGLPNIVDPNVPDDAADADGIAPENWMSALFNQGTEQTDEVIADMISENNLAPYPFENDGTNTDTQYPGGANNLAGLQVHGYEFVTGTTIGGTTRFKGGNFPCGLMKISGANSGNSSNLVIIVDLVPGTHRGYLCEPMTEM